MAAPQLTDYHTVMDARTASGGTKPAELTYRNYLQNERFVILLQGNPSQLTRIAAALADPVWGGWFGRKCNVPALPILPPGPNPSSTPDAAWKSATAALALGGSVSALPEAWTACEREFTSENFALRSDTLLDIPLSFGSQRRYSTRRIRRSSEISTPSSPLDFSS